jgi:hypothetical protein
MSGVSSGGRRSPLFLVARAKVKVLALRMHPSAGPKNSTIERDLLAQAESAIMSQDQASRLFLCALFAALRWTGNGMNVAEQTDA